MNNKIKTQNLIISSDEILAIKKLTDNKNDFYGIVVLFKYGSSLRICNKDDAEAILNIFDYPE